MDLVFASSNKNKVKEIRELIPPSINLLGLSDINCNQDIPETAATIEGNALLKARFVLQQYKLSCFADDSGLEVEVLDGAPGVYSARYAGEEKNDLNNIKKLLNELSGKQNRSAQFKTVIALLWEGREYCFEGIVKGKITEAPRGEKGFGYDPVFVPDGYNRTFAEMELSEKNRISHRAKAVKQLIEFLEK